MCCSTLPRAAGMGPEARAGCHMVVLALDEEGVLLLCLLTLGRQKCVEGAGYVGDEERG